MRRDVNSICFIIFRRNALSVCEAECALRFVIFNKTHIHLQINIVTIFMLEFDEIALEFRDCFRNMEK